MTKKSELKLIIAEAMSRQGALLLGLTGNNPQTKVERLIASATWSTLEAVKLALEGNLVPLRTFTE